MEAKSIHLPLDDKKVKELRSGDKVLLSGIVYTARDAAHKRMIEALNNHSSIPIDLKRATIYYVGPTPAKPGHVIGAAGPTTSGRVDKYTPTLLSLGLKGMIGKGYRNAEVKQAIKDYNAIYFSAIGGSGALLSKSIIAEEVVAYEDLGTEAIRKLTLKDFPVIVINDCYGNDLYEDGTRKYRQL